MYSTRLSLQVCTGEQLLHAFCFFLLPVRSPCADSGPRGLPAAAAGCDGHVHHLTELDPHPLHDQGREGGTRWFVIVIAVTDWWAHGGCVV